MRAAIYLAVLLAMTGCTAYRHTYTNLDGSKDETHFGSFLMMGSANKIRSATKWTNYSRTVSVGGIEGKGDAEFISAIAAGIVDGLKKSQGVP